MKKQLTLCLVVKDGSVLLGMKKRGFGVGLWNGFGGKVAAHETLEEAAQRELTEESGITAVSLEPAGIMEFSFLSEPSVLEVHIFRVEHFLGEPHESEEMLPQWFTFSEIPYAQMWVSDTKWLPYFLNKQQFSGTIRFDQPATGQQPAVIVFESVSVLSDAP